MGRSTGIKPPSLSFPRLALLVTECLLLSHRELKSSTEPPPGPGLPEQCPLRGRSSSCDFPFGCGVPAGGLQYGQGYKTKGGDWFRSLNDQALRVCAQWLIPFSFGAPQCLQTNAGYQTLALLSLIHGLSKRAAALWGSLCQDQVRTNQLFCFLRASPVLLAGIMNSSRSTPPCCPWCLAWGSPVKKVEWALTGFESCPSSCCVTLGK